MNNFPTAIYPMAADDDADRIEAAFDDNTYVAETKYDGCRYLVTIDLDGKVTFTSRQKSKVTNNPVDKTENVPHLVAYFSHFPRGTIIDGEIIISETSTSSEVTKIMGASPDKAIERQKKSGWVKYVAFDILYHKGYDICSMSYRNRRIKLEDTLSSQMHSEYVFISPVYRHNKREKYEFIVDNGGEGIILKNIHGKYAPNKRPLDNWIKVKKYITRDVVVMGFTKAKMEYNGKNVDEWLYWFDPIGNTKYTVFELSTIDHYKAKGYIPVKKPWFNGWIGAVVFGQYVNGILTEIGDTSGMNNEVQKWFTDNQKEAIGMVIEVGAMEQIKGSRALRHPRFKNFRLDKNPEDCVYGEN